MRPAVVLVAVVLCGFLELSFEEKLEEFKCVEGRRYKENNCNECLCEEEELECTRMGCPVHRSDKYLRCKVGAASSEGCNQCWCVDGIGTVCTDNQCNNDVKN